MVISALQGEASAKTNQRPINDFLDQQGQRSDFTPTTGDLVGWLDPETLNFAWVDYAGLADALVPLGTAFTGKVTERPLKDGRVEVLVTLHTKNALAWAFNVLDANFNDPLFFETTPLIFGVRVQDLDEGTAPALASCTLTVKFIHGEPPGGELPDLVQLVNAPDEDQQLLQLKFHTSVSGDLRAQFGVEDGTPGRLIVSQNGLYVVPNAPWPGDFPVEKVVVKQVGN
jgi:hypothetical protein